MYLLCYIIYTLFTLYIIYYICLNISKFTFSLFHLDMLKPAMGLGLMGDAPSIRLGALLKP